MTPAAIGLPAWLAELEPFNALHAATLVGWLIITALLVAAGRAAASAGRERRLANLLGLVAFGVFVFNTAYWLHPDEINLATSLPLHVCDLTLLILPWVLWLRTRWILTLLVLFGVGVSSWGLVLPVEDAGPATARYWVFWSGHGAVVTGGLYAVFVWGYRPGWRDLGFAIAAGLVYAWSMVLLNLVSALERGPAGGLVVSPEAAWHYGYVGPFDDPPAFGGLPWFWRSVVMMGCAGAAMLVVKAVFGGVGRRVGTGGGGGGRVG